MVNLLILTENKSPEKCIKHREKAKGNNNT